MTEKTLIGAANREKPPMSDDQLKSEERAMLARGASVGRMDDIVDAMKKKTGDPSIDGVFELLDEIKKSPESDFKKAVRAVIDKKRGEETKPPSSEEMLGEFLTGNVRGKGFGDFSKD
jgi:hypothetical protein